MTVEELITNLSDFNPWDEVKVIYDAPYEGWGAIEYSTMELEPITVRKFRGIVEIECSTN